VTQCQLSHDHDKGHMTQCQISHDHDKGHMTQCQISHDHDKGHMTQCQISHDTDKGHMTQCQISHDTNKCHMTRCLMNVILIKIKKDDMIFKESHTRDMQWSGYVWNARPAHLPGCRHSGDSDWHRYLRPQLADPVCPSTAFPSSASPTGNQTNRK